MIKPNDGGSFFPATIVVTKEGYVEEYKGASLRAWLAGTESLSEWDNPEVFIGKELSEALAGESTPVGGWSKTPIEMLQFEAKWRAKLKCIRADAMIAELEKGSK